ncbi:MAG: hypothetical protein IT452_18665 [Planctomycetia bacterium]|nr:hypothetical protein [Planctomycetia bacterium]
MSAAGAIGGFLAGAALVAVAVASAGKRPAEAPAPEPAAAEAAPRFRPDDPVEMEGLRAQIRLAEERLAVEDAIAARATAPGGRAGAAVAALAAALKGGASAEDAGKAAKLVAHLLNRLRYEHQLADEEVLIAPLRDRLVPEFLAAMGFPLSEEQRKLFDDLIAFEEQSWKERLEVRRSETPLQRIAAALALAERADDRLLALLTPQQSSTLLAQPLGKTPAENVCMIGRRWVPPGRVFDARADKAKETVYTRWAEDTGIAGVRFEKYAEQYVSGLRDLGPEPRDASGGASVIWRRRQAVLLAQIQKAMLADGEFSEEDCGRIRRMAAADVWGE